MRIYWFSLLLLTPLLAAENPLALDGLKRDFGSINSLTADVIQETLDSRGRLLNRGRGQIVIQRPNKMRWHREPPQEQLLVSNGQLMWFYDPDLEQVTIRRNQTKTDCVPVQVLTGDMTGIEDEFLVDLIEEGDQRSYVLIPRAEAQQCRRIILKVQSGLLVSLAVIDALNQQLVMEFSQVQINVAIDASRFEFIPPEGVDVLEDF